MWSMTAVENLLREWIRKPTQCARGGIGYSWREDRQVTSIHPNDRGWSDPATFKLFADIRDLGWGLVCRQAEWARQGVKEVVLIPPPERRHRSMDRANAIFDHGDLGTKEPDDHELRGWDPGHPCYYILGGRPLRLEEIEPNWELLKIPDDSRLERLTDPAKRTKRLLEMKQEYEQRLQADIECYSEVVTPGYQVSSYDRSMGYGLETSLWLCHNHILHDKSMIAAIKRELAKTNPLLGTDCLAEPFEVSQQPAITVRETYKPVLQAKEQLRLLAS